MKAMRTVAALVLLATPLLSEVVSNAKFPVSLSVFIPCAAGGVGEVVTISGNLHVIFSVTTTRDGLHLRSHAQPQGMNGVGSVTGDRYQGTGVTRSDINMQGIAFPFNFTFVNNFRIIGQGPGNNFLVHATVHTTVNANGTVTSSVNNLSTECK